MGVLQTYDPIWEALAFELALRFRPPEEVAAEYEITMEELQALLENEMFQQKIAEHHREIQKSGVTLQLRAKLAAEQLVDTVFHIARDPEVPPQVRLAAAQTLEKWGRLGEPEQSTGSQAFVLQINLGNSEREVVDVEVSSDSVPRIDLK